jgi:hypothetical protein
MAAQKAKAKGTAYSIVITWFSFQEQSLLLAYSVLD